MSKIKKNLFFRFFAKLFIATLIGMIPAIWVIQNNDKIQLFAKERLIELLQEEWNSKIDIESSKFNIFTGYVFLNNGSIESCRVDNVSEWKFKSAKVFFSRWDYFFHNKLVLKIKFSNVDALTVFKQNNLDLAAHLKDVFTPSERFDVDIKSLQIKNLKLDILINKSDHDWLSQLSSYFHGDFLMNKCELDGQDFWQGSLLLKDGSVFLDGVKIFNKIRGVSSFGKKNNFSDDWNINIDKTFQLAGLNKENNVDCSVIVECNSAKNFFELKSKDGTIFLKSNIFSGKLEGTFPVQKAAQICSLLYKNPLQDSSFTGTCNLDVKFNGEQDFQLDGNIKINDLKAGTFFCKSCNIGFDYKKRIVQTDFSLVQVAPHHLGTDVVITGSGFFNTNKGKGKLSLYNPNVVNLDLKDGFLICPKGFLLDIEFDSRLNSLGRYRLLFCKKNARNKYLFKGNYFLKDKELKLSGKTFQSSYVLEGKFEDRFCLNKFLSFCNGKRLAEILKNDDTDCLVGKIRYSFIRCFLPESLRRTVFGRNSVLSFNLKQSKEGDFKGSALLSGGKLSFWGSYNPVEKVKFDFSIDSLLKKIFFNNIYFKFLKGTIISPKASILLDENYNVNFVYFPLQVDDLLVNLRSDFYSLLYGNVLVAKKSASDESLTSFFRVFGDLVLKKSLFKENIFLSFARRNSLGSFLTLELISQQQTPIEFEVRLSNQNPIKAKTTSLDVMANVDLNLKLLCFNNKLQMPNITGVIDLEKGRLKFLHHTLFIEHGKIQFLPNQMNDPIINLVAKNKIKKYLISLQATGLLQSPDIILESSPELSEEEILALLIAGSENASFKSDLPAILMQNLNSLIVGSKTILPRSKGIFEKLTLPFKYVQITPDFTNHFGRGGIKGTLAIDLSKQLHAQIQKNFNLQDDLSVQVEYFLTDDINFKIVKDQRGEIGSEVEVSLKF